MINFRVRSLVASLLTVIVMSLPVLATSPTVSSVRGVSNLETWPPDQPIRLCAIRVEFREDLVSGTTGNGLMGSWFPDTLRVDPLPHDKAYFEDHLRFLQHYCSTVSKGAVTFSALDVFPVANEGAYQLPNPMWHYNYNISDERLNRKLVELFVESTRLAASDVDFTSYDAIVIFHAGVGKDFNFGYDLTPFDIPSAYISPQDVGAYHTPPPAGVTRGLILPEGENQQEALEYGIELSLNGIMVKLFGNWLGLPDLFDTRTGLSGVGRWAMMDQGSGNLGALVPAMPDAWSRAFMGWQNVLTVPPSLRGDTVRVARFGAGGAPEIVKLPVTPREYYLVENRDADADSVGYVTLWDRDGRVMRVDREGNLAIADGFRIAVGASDYDFGVPGSGLLIWHIDENVIDSGLLSNTVNANPSQRGVDLVEADGAQDIGQQYGFASAGSGAELGVQEDAWYRENDAHRIANRASPDVQFRDNTYPSARLHDGAHTYYELRSFSSVGPVMSFVARGAALAPGFPVSFGMPARWGVADLDGDGSREIYFAAADSLFAADSAGMHFLFALSQSARPSPLVPVDVNGDGREDILFEGNAAGYLTMRDGDQPQVELLLADFPSSSSTRLYPGISAQRAHCILAVTPEASGIAIRLLDVNLQLVDTALIYLGPDFSPAVYNVETFPSTHFLFVNRGAAALYGISGHDTLGLWMLEEIWRLENARISGTATVLAEPSSRSLFLTGYGYVSVDSGVLLCQEPDCLAPGKDWDGDGIPEGGGLRGAVRIEREDAPHLSADTVWTIDLDVDRDADLLGLSYVQDSLFTRWHAVEHRGRLFRGFPMAVSGTEGRRPFRWTSNNDFYFVSEVAAGERYYYSVTKLPVVTRPGERFPYEEEINIVNVGVLAPQVHVRPDWLYCWPNPASEVSRIRITTPYAAKARVRVFDLAGRQVAELSGESSIAGPLEIPWDVTNVEDGIYIGQVQLSGSGAGESAQVKIAVVK